VLRWPIEAGRAIVRLFSPLQDEVVFVEDQGDEGFYTELCRRLVGNDVRIERAVALGGRDAVLDACRAAQGELGPNVWLVDGDFEWVRGESAEELEGLVRLEAYCIENMLIDGEAVAEIVREELGGVALEQVQDLLQFQLWADASEEVLVDLFVVFAAVNKALPEEPTVSRGIGSILTASKKREPARVSKAKADKLKAEMRRAIERAGVKAAFDSTEAAVRRRVEGLQDPLRVVSGKDFLLPALMLHAKSNCDVTLRRQSFRFRLARQVDLEGLASLSTAVREAAGR